MLFVPDMPSVLGLHELALLQDLEAATAWICRQRDPMKRIVLGQDVAYAASPSVAVGFLSHSLALVAPTLRGLTSSMRCYSN